MLNGKGIFLWQTKFFTPKKLAEDLKSLAMDWVAIDWRTPNDFAIVLIEDLRRLGVTPVAWGSYSHPNQAAQEAHKGSLFCRKHEIKDYIWDPENKWKAGVILNRNGTDAQARLLLDNFRDLAPDVKIGLCTWKWPSYHKEMPWETMLCCDYYCPQVYWMKAHNPVAQLALAVKEYTDLFMYRPIFPIGAAFSEHGWKATPEEVVSFAHAAGYTYGYWYADEMLCTDERAYKGTTLAECKAWRDAISIL